MLLPLLLLLQAQCLIVLHLFLLSLLGLFQCTLINHLCLFFDLFLVYKLGLGTYMINKNIRSLFLPLQSLTGYLPMLSCRNARPTPHKLPLDKLARFETMQMPSKHLLHPELLPDYCSYCSLNLATRILFEVSLRLFRMHSKDYL